MTDHELTSIILVFNAAYALNNVYALAGAPCQSVFNAAKQALITLYGAEIGDLVYIDVISTGEYSVNDLRMYAKNAGWSM